MVYTFRNENTVEIKSSFAEDESPLSGETDRRLGLSEFLNTQGEASSHRNTYFSHMTQLQFFKTFWKTFKGAGAVNATWTWGALREPSPEI